MGNSLSRRVFFIAAFFCIAAALVLRFVALNHIPGFNGDEAWFPMQMRYLLSGRDFTLRTPTQRWISPTFVLVQGLFQLLPWTGVGILRLPTALASLVSVLVIPPLFRQILSRVELTILTLLVACMPILIAYAHSLGEMSQVPIAMAIVLALSARGKIYWALVALALAATIHPTCMLAFPILIFGVCGDSGWRQRMDRKFILICGAVVVALAVWQIDTIKWRLGYTLPMFLYQIQNPHAFVIYILGIVRVFTGSNVVQIFISPTSDEFKLWSDIFAGASLVFVFGYGTFLLWRDKKASALWNLLGLVLAFAVLYLISAPAEPPFEPGFERYVLYLMVPLALQMTLLISEIIKAHPLQEKFLLGGIVLACAAMVISFKMIYFDAAHDGHPGHFSYRTGDVDPKWAAFEWIKKDQIENRRANLIAAESWFAYWPMVYFDAADRHFDVEYLDPKGFQARSEGNRTMVDVTKQVYATIWKGGYLIGFKGELLDSRFKPPASIPMLRKDFTGYNGEVLVSVWRKAN